MKKTYTEKRFFDWYEDEVSVSIRNHSGSYGGGQRSICCRRKTDSLCARDYKGIGNQFIEEGKVIVEIYESLFDI